MAVDLGTAGKPWIKLVFVQKGILDFIQGLPNCVGVGIREDVKKIEDFLSILTNSLVKMKPALDLEVIALISGWQMENFTMKCMSVQIMGTILNRCVGFGDWKWGQQWEYISRSMKVYTLSNLQAT